MNNSIRRHSSKPGSLRAPLAALLLCAAAAEPCPGAAVFRSANGANAVAIQTAVDQFRTDLGGANNGVGGTFKTGRREINWDGVPDASAAPNFFPSNFFNATSARGVVFGSPASNAGNDTSNFIVSASAASGTAVRFGNIEASYASIFQTFSAERLFTIRSSTANSSVLSVQFFVPGTAIPATVKGFGVVCADVDSNINAILRVYGIDGRLLTVPVSITAANNGLSFLGISFNAGEGVARVELLCGNRPLGAGNIDGTGGVDVIALDDFIYGEPQALMLPVAATATLAATVIEAHIPMSYNAVSQAGAPAGFFRTFLRCSPHHTYRFFSSTDLVNWTPAVISGNPAGANANLLDPRGGIIAYQTATLGVQVDLQKSGPSRFFRAVDQNDADAVNSSLVP